MPGELAKSTFKGNAANNQSGYHREETIKKKFSINQRFVLKCLIPIGTFYKTYKGIDLHSKKFVTVYIKPNSKQRIFSKNIKEELKQKITPPLKWAGTEKIDKNLFDVEVYCRYGPSLEQIMAKYRQRISEKTFFLLAYHLLKLIDRIDSAGYSMRSLSARTVVLAEQMNKNDLYLFNTFDMERKGEETFGAYDLKYCSLGTHLKIKTSSKDTVESMCYLLIDFYLKGALFGGRLEKQKDYMEAKSTLKPEGIPFVFLQFFEYVKNLSYNQEIKFTEWKIKFKKCISEQDFNKPYEWAQSSSKSKFSGLDSQSPGANNDMGLESVLKEIGNYDKTVQSQIQQPQIPKELDSSFDGVEDIAEIEEGDVSNFDKVQEKMIETNSFRSRIY